MEPRPPLVLLTTVSGAFRAHVLVARLGAEGIDAQLRGAFDGAYGFTVGDLARVDVYVPVDQLDDANLVLLADEVDATLEPDVGGNADPAGPRPADHLRWVRWVALAMLVVAVLGAVLRAVAWNWD